MPLAKVLVTGFIPIQDHPRPRAEYDRLAGKMFYRLDCEAGNFSIHPFYETVEETWLCKLIAKLGIDVTHSTADNPEKNSLAYHCVQHQKFAWLLKASIANPEAETFVWVDYGIGHVPGVTADVIQSFMEDLRRDDFAIPGCWDRAGLLIDDSYPCWRFCGGVMVVPRDQVPKLYNTIKTELECHIRSAGNVSWEVNSLARVEPLLPKLRWYAADHNQTLFTNYGK